MSRKQRIVQIEALINIRFIVWVLVGIGIVSVVSSVVVAKQKIAYEKTLDKPLAELRLAPTPMVAKKAIKTFMTEWNKVKQGTGIKNIDTRLLWSKYPRKQWVPLDLLQKELERLQSRIALINFQLKHAKNPEQVQRALREFFYVRQGFSHIPSLSDGMAKIKKPRWAALIEVSEAILWLVGIFLVVILLFGIKTREQEL